MTISFGKLIRARRRAKMLTQSDLAAKLGITRGALSHWEAGKFTPSIRYLAALSETLDYNFVATLSPALALPRHSKGQLCEQSILSSESLLSLMNTNWRKDRIPIFACDQGSGSESDIIITANISAFLPAPHDFDDNVKSGIRISGRALLPSFDDGDVVMLNSQISKNSNLLMLSRIKGLQRSAIFGQFIEIQNGRICVQRHGNHQVFEISAFDAFFGIAHVSRDR